ncbi:MAG: DUF2757 family protein [Firmicutes bacterium]|nr:DUF2757 family protein [Bacillota bacterium]MCL5040209.1 DUF2757 family protein [Bacillota bacterium]
MRVRYVCDRCGHLMSELTVTPQGLKKLGLYQLTEAEREDIIKYDEGAGVMIVSTICDCCLEPETEEIRPGYTVMH